jgi:hypothetical protein
LNNDEDATIFRAVLNHFKDEPTVNQTAVEDLTTKLDRKLKYAADNLKDFKEFSFPTEVEA